MPDREKVIRGLECCNKTGRERYLGGCERCPYYDHGDPLDCRARLDLDALDLLVDDEIREGGENEAGNAQPNKNAAAHDA